MNKQTNFEFEYVAADTVCCPYCEKTGMPEEFNGDAYSFGDCEEFDGVCPTCGKFFHIKIEDETIRYYGTKQEE